MVDVVNVATRSKMMAGIKGVNTLPEIFIRKALHARGIRFRIHAKHLAGKPDLLLPKYKTVIFIHGCFWHGHTCRYFKIPKTRTEFWLEKIEGNQARDRLHETTLRWQGWRVLVIWECAVRMMRKEGCGASIDLIVEWLKGGNGGKCEMDENLAIFEQ